MHHFINNLFITNLLQITANFSTSFSCYQFKDQNSLKETKNTNSRMITYVCVACVWICACMCNIYFRTLYFSHVSSAATFQNSAHTYYYQLVFVVVVKTCVAFVVAVVIVVIICTLYAFCVLPNKMAHTQSGHILCCNIFICFSLHSFYLA